MHTLERILQFIFLIWVLILLCCCISALTVSKKLNPTSIPIPTPTPLSAETLVQIPGVTEPVRIIPCYHGSWETLKFGETTDAQVAQWINTSKQVHQPSLLERTDETGFTHVYMWDIADQAFPDPYLRLKLNVISETLSSLNTPVFYPLTLQETIEELGSPEFVRSYRAGREDCLYMYELYYPTQGIAIKGALWGEYGESLCDQVIEANMNLLEADWPVTRFACSAPGTLQEIIEAMYGLSPDDANSTAELAHPWKGFGQVYPLEP